MPSTMLPDQEILEEAGGEQPKAVEAAPVADLPPQTDHETDHESEP